MKKEQANSYEYQERAAIRQFEAGAELLEANQLALMDIRERVPLDEARKRLAEQQLQAKHQQENPNEARIEQLQQERDVVRKAWMAEKEPRREAELKQKWLDLCTRIIELRKGT